MTQRDAGDSQVEVGFLDSLLAKRRLDPTEDLRSDEIEGLETHIRHQPLDSLEILCLASRAERTILELGGYRSAQNGIIRIQLDKPIQDRWIAVQAGDDDVGIE